MAMITSKVLGTVRVPDGRAKGVVDGLVIRENGLLVVVSREEAWLMASRGQLQATVPGSASSAMVEALGEPGPGARLSLPDAEGRDDLPWLPIWDRERACWVNPLRPDGPSLPGPSLGL
jgi:hypothetical protein